MLETEKVTEIKRLLSLGLSQRQIARKVGVSRAVIQRIAAGKRKDIVPKTKEPWEAAATGKIGRCPVCGANVKLPCLYCIVRKLAKPDIETKTMLDIELQLKPKHRYEKVKALREILLCHSTPENKEF